MISGARAVYHVSGSGPGWRPGVWWTIRSGARASMEGRDVRVVRVVQVERGATVGRI